MNKVLSKYNIHISGLEDKRYEFEFEGNDSFFESFEQELIHKGNFESKIVLDKSATMIQLYFHIKGSVELTCDRSLDFFDEPVDIQEKYIFKYGDRNELLSDEIELILFGTPTINVSQHIFDFIALTIPMRKLHPRFRDEDDDSDEILIYQTEKSVPKIEKKVEVDPRWAKLKEFKPPTPEDGL